MPVTNEDSRRLEITVDQAENTIVVTPAGEVDMANAGELESVLRAALRDLRGRTRPVLVIDLGRVDFMGSAGLSVLLRVCLESPVRLANPTAAVQRVLDVGGLNDVLVVHTTVAAALTA
ncbi:MAG TPA: STAS domain-containing protein [Actinokineospora sp.]|jgi:anti-anti-sigma factor|nr:STAS domain-containing protein [Actinokineospora sp.]